MLAITRHTAAAVFRDRRNHTKFSTVSHSVLNLVSTFKNLILGSNLVYATTATGTLEVNQPGTSIACGAKVPGYLEVPGTAVPQVRRFSGESTSSGAGY